MMKRKENGNVTCNVILLIAAFTFLIVICLDLSNMSNQDKTRQDALTLAQNGYETYYNGQKIDYDKIDFNHCSVTIDNMNNRILLTQD